MTNFPLLSVLLCLLLFTSCGDDTPTVITPPPAEKPMTEQEKAEAEAELSRIKDNSFYGIKLGEQIASYGDRFDKIKMGRTGGAVDVWQLVHPKYGILANVLENEEVPGTVGEIFILSQGAKYEDTGLGISSTWREVRGRFPSIEVRTTEEGELYAQHNEVGFLFALPAEVYDGNLTSIPDDTRVMSLRLGK